MKVLLVNGSPHPHGCTDVALSEVAMQLGKHGIETEMLWLGNEAIHGCIACGKCRKAGKCIFDDAVNRVAAKAEEYDGIVVGSPVYYGGPDSQICAFLDRLFYSAGKKFVRKPAAAVVSCRRGGATASFERLNKYFEMSNMPLVTSQYWNQIHGNNAEEAKQDAEGLQTMRTLAENMAWLLKCIEAGKKAGVEEPVYEPFHATNFIR
ncbi:flavodoxin family protein [Erysipelotrichaceae bacterium Oil+RF-744-GAM-WT-6]|jgi:multimeric flavodoxin WrbA|uniref:Flavodoxin family protein n=1 Tax=Stecheria intestinalis TaxID=2606630 RepID=A0A7X2NU08_9FIRM|nr:flavodoxin family protein [Stecheria intestinalis]MCI6746517.1 flavodoxin family protein [Anaerolactibacter massiliensis]MDD5880323.1 flavodoxin family protein [Stecheria intestinalis]MSS59266.1 flavodoxin family protein [Stecheria intestinalis]